MREIKFRLWDKQDQKYFEPTYEAYKGNLLDMSISRSGELFMRTLSQPSIHESVFTNRYIIEQYTGLKDKNGTDRYEGDIIRRFTGYKFVEEKKWFMLGASNQAKAFGYDFHEGDEIIGNVHQNSELI